MDSSTVVLKNREYIEITGVLKLESLNEQEFVLATTYGALQVRGNDLEMVNLNIDNGVLKIKGLINSIDYGKKDIKKTSLMSKLFK